MGPRSGTPARAWPTCAWRRRSRSPRSGRGARALRRAGVVAGSAQLGVGGCAAAWPGYAVPLTSRPPCAVHSSVTNTFGFRFTFDLRQDQWGQFRMPPTVLPSNGGCHSTPCCAHHRPLPASRPGPLACTCWQTRERPALRAPCLSVLQSTRRWRWHACLRRRRPQRRRRLREQRAAPDHVRSPIPSICTLKQLLHRLTPCAATCARDFLSRVDAGVASAARRRR